MDANAPSEATPLDAAAARQRLVRRADMVACKVAFIDCKMPGSHLKENYSLIGAGVSQSADQVVNLVEPHGFSLGVAAMPAGIVNNLHLHYTAEVFMVYSGQWTFRWGADGQDGEITGGPGDVVSVPTWIFRGFTNTGTDDGWIFTALGGDDTGGIIWHPSILETASAHGLYLTRRNMMVDTAAGAVRPDHAELLPPIDRASVDGLRHYSTAEMRSRVVAIADRRWSGRALLDSVLPGHASALAPVLGHGMGEDRDQALPIAGPHGFSLEWLRVAPGERVGRFALAEKQVLIVFKGAIEITLGGPDDAVGDAVTVRVESQDLFSVPPQVWRSIASVGEEPAELAMLIAGDGRKHARWAPAVVSAAAAAGWALDHNAYLAPRHLLPEAHMLAVE